jgi:putative RNA 2'-phosphotransferase
MNRHHVHLTTDAETALQVGKRHGKPVVLTIKAGEMHKAGYTFYVSANGVWLTGAVPVRFIETMG